MDGSDALTPTGATPTPDSPAGTTTPAPPASQTSPPTVSPGAASPPDAGADARERASGVADHAGQSAGEVKDHALHEVADLKEEAKEQLRDVAGQARHHLGDVATTASTELKAQAGEQATRMGGGLEDIARQLSAMADAADEPGMVPDLVGSLGSQVSTIASRLQEGSLDDVLDDVRRFARRRPGMFLLAAAGAGFAASRVLRLTDLSPGQLTPDTTSQDNSGEGSTSQGRTSWDGPAIAAGPTQAPALATTPNQSPRGPVGEDVPSLSSGTPGERPDRSGGVT